MPDREKVIKGLEILMNGCEYIQCEDCCFFISTKPTRCGLREEQIQEDALALLKEQEAVEPIIYHHGDGTIFKYECRQCRTKIFKMDLFCRHCGLAVKWE
jgi:hypothetical protein